MFGTISQQVCWCQLSKKISQLGQTRDKEDQQNIKGSKRFYAKSKIFMYMWWSFYHCAGKSIPLSRRVSPIFASRVYDFV